MFIPFGPNALRRPIGDYAPQDGAPIFLRLRRPPVASLAVTANASGLYRISDATVEGFELYRGVDAYPNLSASPWETYTSEPHTTGSLAANHTYHFVRRYRNRWNLLSQNIDETVIKINGSGNEVGVPPSDCTDETATPAAAGTVLITARYAYVSDGDLQADEFLIYVTFNGVDPDPSMDTPVEVTMLKSDGIAKLTYTTAAQSEGTTVKAIIRVRRSAAPISDSSNATIVSAIATLLGPSAVTPASSFLGSNAQQTQ